MKKTHNYFRRLAGVLVVMMASGNSAQAENLNWYGFRPDPDRLAPVVDFSGLNRRIGEEDKIVAHDGHFFKVGRDRRPGTADDQRIRIFGINLSGPACFPDEEQARILALRFKRLGLNAVRLHQMDAALSDESSPPTGLLTNSAFPSFHPEAIRRLRHFIGVLREEGIYVNLNLHVNYRFRPAVDQVNPMLDGAQMPVNSHPLHLIDPRMIALQAEFARQLLRQLELKNDPALAMVEINNESSLVGAWQRGELDKLNGEYERTWTALWRKWIAREYGSTEVACQRWKTCDLPAQGAVYLKKDEAIAPETGSGWIERIRRLGRKLFHKLGLPLPGFLEVRYQPAAEGLGLRAADFVRFLIETDQQYFENLRQVIRQEAGEQVAVTGTQRYFGGIANQLSQRNMDYADEHFYTDHYDFPGGGWSDQDWRIRNASSLRDTTGALLKRSFYRDRQKPFVVSEFNQAYPNRQSAEMIPAMVTLASLQDWDGLFFFQYGQMPDDDTWLSAFNLNNHSSQLVSFGTLASVFRQFQMTALPEQQLLPVTEPEMISLALSGESIDPAVMDDFVRRRFGLVATDTLQYRVSVQTAASSQAVLRQKSIATGTQAAVSVWNAQPGQLIWADRFAAVYAGFGDASTTTGWSVQHAPGSRGFAVASLTTRDGMPLEKSRRLLLTVAGASTGSQKTGTGFRPKHLVPYKGDAMWQTLEPDQSGSTHPSGSRSAQGPVWMEKLDISIGLPVSGQKVTVYQLDERGQRSANLASDNVILNNGMLTLRIRAESPWYEIIVK
ncbi:hypothetical protein [Undibacterium squillarum]|uniref:hypothetical protein n=1 Tax=Undibacterium squillarum TaxID=1131567 RepID=UPI0035B05386